MATPAQFTPCLQTNLRTILFPPDHKKNTLFFFHTETRRTTVGRRRSVTRVASGDSYLDLWKKAVDREKSETLFQKMAENSINEGVEEEEDLEKKADEFKKLLEVPKEERDRVQRMQVIDRASAAIAAARALLKENPPLKSAERSESDSSVEVGWNRRKGIPKQDSSDSGLTKIDSVGIGSNGAIPTRQEDYVESARPETDLAGIGSNGSIGIQQEATENRDVSGSESGIMGHGTPGPDFWSWTPPLDINTTSEDASQLQTSGKPAPFPDPTIPLMEKERTADSLSIPFQSFMFDDHEPPLPPLQSLVEIAKVDVSESMLKETVNEELNLLSTTTKAAEAANALHEVVDVSSQGVHPDGSKYWKETGVEQRPDGVLCRWTLIRGVSTDGSVEWEEKYWEAAGQFDYKELGSEKSGRDATGNVWREYWKENMWQDQGSGLVHMEKNADKWGKDGYGGEWHEKWWEHYNASGQAEKWADKWCSIDPNTPLDAGHAHVWHERWGETYDGHGASIKYTDKWAERLEGDEWTKWGDKWDENFNQQGHGVKQGEKWWQGKYGEQWNRTWGEHHNGSGWIHKYGKSSCGEHWDTHVEQDTWYERHPHFGYDHCFENSVHLREVGTPTGATRTDAPPTETP